MGVNEVRINMLWLLCQLGLVLWLGSVLFDFLVEIIWLRYVWPHGECNRKSPCGLQID